VGIIAVIHDFIARGNPEIMLEINAMFATHWTPCSRDVEERQEWQIWIRSRTFGNWPVWLLIFFFVQIHVLPKINEAAAKFAAANPKKRPIIPLRS
jgi:hypothetical protein